MLTRNHILKAKPSTRLYGSPHASEDSPSPQDLLFAAIASLNSTKECRLFLTDLCTPAELTAMADRWLTAQRLAAGESYRSIYQSTGVSTATVTRVARSLTQGTGGYQLVLSRSKKVKAPRAK